MHTPETVTSRRPSKLDNWTPSKQLARAALQSIEEVFSAPEEYIARKQYSQKNDSEEDQKNPNLSMFMALDSRRAREEWINWVEMLSETTGDEIFKLFLSEEEYQAYTDLKKEVEVFDEEDESNERSSIYALISETPKFVHAKIPDFEPVSGERTVQELDFHQEKSSLERHGRELVNDVLDFSFTDPVRDPDFINPLSTNSTTRFILQPASRPYNLVFKCKFTDPSGKERVEFSKPKCKKDYTTADDLNYLLTSKGCKDIEIITWTNPSSIKFEYDLRLSPLNPKIIAPDGKVIEELVPDPVSYKKIDNESPLGRRLLRSLRENPYHEWKEISWKWQETTKVALVRKSEMGLFWVYLDDRHTCRGYKRVKVINPQITDIYDSLIFSGARYLVEKQVRASDYKELPEPFCSILKNNLTKLVNSILSDGFVFVSKSPHDDFGAIVYSFVKKEFSNPKDRYIARLEK